MKKSSSELKYMAKELLLGHYGLFIGAGLIIGSISVAVSLVLNIVFPLNTTVSMILYFICSLIVGLLSNILIMGYLKMFLNLSRGQETNLGTLGFAFSNQPDRVILLTLLMTLLMLLCILPGILLILAADFMHLISVSALGIFVLLAGCIAAIILALNYALAALLYLDTPEKGVIQLMRESRRLMKGNRVRFFYLQISFFGLVLLSLLTCYIGMLWLIPYMQMTSALFYRNVLQEI
ncbi:DUF975 family protein [Lachnospiraceae bacterium 46-15]